MREITVYVNAMICQDHRRSGHWVECGQVNSVEA